MAQKRGRYLALTSGCLAVAGGLVYLRQAHPAKPAPLARNGVVYYTGPMVQKGNPGMYGYEDGSRAPTPPGAATSAAGDPRARTAPGRD